MASTMEEQQENHLKKRDILIHLIWILCHVGIRINDNVDCTAKEGITRNNNTSELSKDILKAS